jgi:HEAT repeat protein
MGTGPGGRASGLYFIGHACARWKTLAGGFMSNRTLGSLFAALLLLTTNAAAQGSTAKKEPVADGRTLSQWVADLNAPAPQTRNAAAYEISGMGPAAAPAVPALIKALDDPSGAVRFPVTVALREIGPAASAAVPRLKKMMEEETNDELASAAKRAIRRIQPEALAGQ